MLTGTQSQLRGLVIKLACLDSKDRKWILGQLTDSENSYIRPLLKELDEMGIAENYQLVEECLEELASSSSETGAKDKKGDMPKQNIHWNSVKQLDPVWQSIIHTAIEAKSAGSSPLTNSNLLETEGGKHLPPFIADRLIELAEEEATNAN